MAGKSFATDPSGTVLVLRTATTASSCPHWQVRSTRYTLTGERLVCQQGILHRTQDEVEIYRIKDYTITAPLFYRWFGIANLVLFTSDRTHPELVLKGITDAYQVKELIRTQVEALRMLKSVREID